jgi:hypothetical protein
MTRLSFRLLIYVNVIFLYLIEDYFERWESLIDYLGNVIIFYLDCNDVLGQDGLKKLREWYRLEKERRRYFYAGK